MFRIKSLGVFCGAADGKNPRYVKDAAKLGKTLAENNIRLVYGAGHVGMMGAVAKGVLDTGGHVTGLINTFLQNREEQLFKLSELKIFPSLHIRKDAMYEASDAFCILPGGIGTLDEVFEVMTLKQLEEHRMVRTGAVRLHAALLPTSQRRCRDILAFRTRCPTCHEAFRRSLGRLPRSTARMGNLQRVVVPVSQR